LPSTIVVGGLVSLAWLGHHNDWKLPTFDASASSTVDGPEWCDSHGVPEAECINCVPGLIEDQPELLFCKEHGVHGCVLDNPSLAETKAPVEVLPTDLERAALALAIRPRRENLALSRFPGTRIQFASVEAMQRAGVDVEPVERRDVTESISTAAEVRYDATRTAQVSPSVDGIVRAVNVNVGDWVNAERVLAVVDSEKVGRLKSELLSSLSEERLQRQTVARLKPLAQSQAIAGKRLIEAEAALQQAEVAVDRAVRALRNLGLQFDSERLRTLNTTQISAEVRRLGMERIELSAIGTNQNANDNWIAVTAPLEGRVVQRNAVVGEVVDRGSEMFRISDTRTVWLDLRVSAEDSRLAQIGQEVRYRPDGSTELHRGKVIWISSDVDAVTRTVRVRAELTNMDGRLRNESFGTGDIVLREENEAIVVPSNAVQWDGENSLVFVRDKRFFEEGRPKFFVARSVRVGVSENGYTEIIAGVLPGEVVASSGSDVLRAQLLKSNLGAGCTCGH
jgi:multidrug efflux pump subunit AcrA (membrane-fusion protein)